MYRLKVKSEFSAAHNLREYRGKCEALHGHNWKVEVVIAAVETDAQGFVIDFHEIKEKLKRVLEQLDHGYLNKISYFKTHNPTSENLARYIFEKLGPEFKLRKAVLQEVTVWESDNCCATYDA